MAGLEAEAFLGAGVRASDLFRNRSQAAALERKLSALTREHVAVELCMRAVLCEDAQGGRPAAARFTLVDTEIIC